MVVLLGGRVNMKKKSSILYFEKNIMYFIHVFVLFEDALSRVELLFLFYVKQH